MVWSVSLNRKMYLVGMAKPCLQNKVGESTSTKVPNQKETLDH
jgi:hypothetical protein